MKTNLGLLYLFLAFSVSTLHAAVGVNTASKDDTLSGNISGDVGASTDAYGIGAWDRHGLVNGIDSGVKISAVGDRSFDGTTNSAIHIYGATGVFFQGQMNPLYDIGGIAAEISSTSRNGTANGIYFYNSNQASAAGVSSNITVKNTSGDSAYGIRLFNSGMGDFSGTIEVAGEGDPSAQGSYLAGILADAMSTTLTMQNGVSNSIGNVSGTINVSGASQAMGILLRTGPSGHATLGNIGESAEITVVSTERNAYGIAVDGREADNPGSATMGDVAGKISVTSNFKDGTAAGIIQSVAGVPFSIGDILSTAAISVEGAGYVYGIKLDGLDTMGVIEGSISATAMAGAKSATALHLDGGVDGKTVELRGDASLSARFATKPGLALAIKLDKGDLVINGDLGGTQTLTGGISAAGGITLNAGNYVLDNFWSTNYLTAGTSSSIVISEGAKVDFIKNTQITTVKFDVHGEIILHADDASAYGYGYLNVNAGAREAQLFIDDSAALYVMLGEGFQIEQGAVMHIIRLSATDLITGVFEEFELFYADGSKVDKSLYELMYDYEGKGGVSIVFAVPEPAQAALLLGSLFLAFALLRRRS